MRGAWKQQCENTDTSNLKELQWSYSCAMTGNKEVSFTKNLKFFPVTASLLSLPSAYGPYPILPSNNSIILQPLQQV